MLVFCKGAIMASADTIDTLLDELEAFGLANDAEHAERASHRVE